MKSKWDRLTAEEERVIVRKGTETPFSGEYDNFFKKGTYVCRRCGSPLYKSGDKFDAHCGWPAFDDEIPSAIKRVPDSDGIRTEIECAKCGAHLGHVFYGEHMTKKDVRHCVNSISMKFIDAMPIALIVRADGDHKVVAIDSTTTMVKSWNDIPAKGRELILKYFGYKSPIKKAESAEAARAYIKKNRAAK